MIYAVTVSNVLTAPEHAQLVRHYKRLGLAGRYRVRAASHMAAFKESVATLHAAAVERTLQQKIETATVGEPLNGWLPALYRAIDAKKAETLDWLISNG